MAGDEDGGSSPYAARGTSAARVLPGAGGPVPPCPPPGPSPTGFRKVDRTATEEVEDQIKVVVHDRIDHPRRSVHRLGGGFDEVLTGAERLAGLAGGVQPRADRGGGRLPREGEGERADHHQ